MKTPKLHAFIYRFEDDGKQTLGNFRLYDHRNETVMRCVTLEPAWLNNQVGVSCLPPGAYIAVPRISPRYGRHYIILTPDGKHPPGRTWVLIHYGNYRRNTRGCILPGQAHLDIDGDGLRDVTSSKPTCRMLNKVCTIAGVRQPFRLTIVDETRD